MVPSQSSEGDQSGREKKKLCEVVGKPKLLMGEQTGKLHQFLAEHHDVFSLSQVSVEKLTGSPCR